MSAEIAGRWGGWCFTLEGCGSAHGRATLPPPPTTPTPRPPSDIVPTRAGAGTGTTCAMHSLATAGDSGSDQPAQGLQPSRGALISPGWSVASRCPGTNATVTPHTQPHLPPPPRNDDISCAAVRDTQTHVVFFAIAQTGHINPTLPIVRWLVSSGHAVTYYLTSSDHIGVVAAAGATARVVPPLESSVLSSRPSLLDLPDAALGALPWILSDLEMLTVPPSVIVYDVLAKWGGWAASLLSIPAVCSSSTFVLDPGDLCSINPKPTAVHLAAIATLSQRYDRAAPLFCSLVQSRRTLAFPQSFCVALVLTVTPL